MNPAGHGRADGRAHRRGVAHHRDLGRKPGAVGADLRPEPAFRAAAEQQQRLHRHGHLAQPLDHVAHGEGAALEQSARHVTRAMRRSQPVEAATRRGDPFRRHGAAQCRQERDAGGPCRDLGRKPIEFGEILPAQQAAQPGQRAP